MQEKRAQLQEISAKKNISVYYSSVCKMLHVTGARAG